MKAITPKIMFIVLILLTTLISTLYNPSISNLFLGFVIGIFIFIEMDRGNRTIHIEKTVDRTKSVMVGVSGWVVSIFLTYITLGIFYLTKTLSIDKKYSFQSGLNSIFDLLIETKQALVFGGSAYFEFIAFGIYIPIVETLFFFMVLYEIGIELGRAVGQKVLFDKSFKINLPTLIIFSVISYLFTYYHLSSKGLDNVPAQVGVFIFAFVSLYLVKIEGQALGSILTHIINNSVALLLSLAVIVSTPLLWGIGIGVGLLIILSIIKGRLEIPKLIGG